MTREEAIQIFLDRGWIKLENGTYFDGSKWREAIMVISDYFRNEYKALEQKPKSEWQHDHEILKAYSDGANEVLDKIRGEISEQSKMHMDGDLYIKVSCCMQIIDKYKPESEDKK